MENEIQRYLTRARVEEFIFAEAALLDDWALDAWLTLFSADCSYEVAPTGVSGGFELSPASSFFYIVDDHQRLAQRVARLQKPSAHVEYPHSRTRHLYGNVRVTGDDRETLTAMVNFVTYRTKNRQTVVYPGSSRYRLQREGANLKIRSKRIVLDLDGLIPQGKLSIIL